MSKLFDDHEVLSSTWKKLSGHLEERLIMLRLKNDASLSPEHTQKVRGQIGEIKRTLSLSRPDVDYEDITGD